MSTMTRNDNDTVTISVVIDGNEWKKAQKNVVNKLASSMNIKGFRKGKVPANVVKRLMTVQGILERAAEEIANKQFPALLEEHHVDPIDRPSFSTPVLTEEKAEFEFVCPVAPKIELGDWKHLGIEKPEVSVTDEQVDAQIDQLRREATENVLLEEGQEAKEGDTVNADFTGYIDGEPFEGGQAKNAEIVLGSHSFIPGFEEALIGIKPEEEKEITVTFPEDYPAENLAGKEAVFKVTAHDIYTPSVPELNDEFAKNAAAYDNPETVDELKERVRAGLLETAQEEADDAYLGELLAALRKQINVTPPAAMVAEETEAALRNYKNTIARSGLNWDVYLNYMKTTEDDIKETDRPEAEKRVLNTLIFDALIEAENLTISDEEYEKAVEDAAKQYNTDVETIQKAITRDNLERPLLYDKAMEVLAESQEPVSE